VPFLALDLTTALVAVGAAIPAAVAAVLVSARRFSGKIRSSEAVTLWEAQESFRKDLQTRNDRLRDRLDSCEKIIETLQARLDEMEEINSELRIENGELVAKIKEYDKLISNLRAQLIEKDEEIHSLQERVRELEEHHV